MEYKHVYPIFNHWYHGGQVYFYGDPHFGDFDSYIQRCKFVRSAIDLGTTNKSLLAINQIYIDYKNGRISKEEFIRKLDELQIKNMNKCGKNDTLVITGDLCDKDKLEYGLECVKKLKAGYKVLIMGNHDKGRENYEHYWFDEVYPGKLTISEKITVSHEPVHDEFTLNIHSHDHMCSYIDDLHINVIAEKIGFEPICLKHIVESGLLKKVPDIHRNTIDKATDKKEKRLKKDGK